MDKIFKFVNVMIIILSLLFVSTQSQVYVPVPCVTDRDCRTSTRSLNSKSPRIMKCRKGYCV
ncbi:unnamed protein product [Trifolium pratense]|uniref:Uncharacterized protein n=1 Tax=Trifolium pratense TaxID=57577 RepID=A0ACB0LMT8_TRIPR|nr:unnamed protein product [Trifolium pratense]